MINVEERHHHRHHHPGIEQRNRYRDPNVSPSPLRMKIGVFNESIFDLYPAGFHPFCLHYYILITFRSITWVRAYVRKRANSPELFFYRRYSIPAYIYIYSRDDNYSYRSLVIVHRGFKLREKERETRNYPRSYKVKRERHALRDIYHDSFISFASLG